MGDAMIPSRSWAPLPEKTEEALSNVVDAGMRVHKELGVGFIEATYRNALCIELRVRGIPFEVEKTVIVTYRGQAVSVHRMDLIVDSVVVVELKAVEALGAVHQAQIMSYMRAAGLRAGLLMNFGRLTLKQGLKRIVI